MSLVLIKRFRERRESKISFCNPRDSRASPQSFCDWGDAFSVFGVFVDGCACFLFCLILMLLCVMGAEFDNTCTVSGKWISWLYGCVYKIFRLINVKVAYSVVVMSASFHSRVSQFVSCGNSVFDSRFTKFVLRNSRSIKLWCYFRTLTLVARVQLPLE